MPNSQRVYFGNLAHDVRERDVEKFLKGYGKFGEVSLKQGYGFVDFEDYRDADDCVHDLNGKDLLGERVRVQLAHDRRERERRRGFGGRRSPGRFGGGGGGRFGGGSGGRPRGGGPGRKTNHRIIVENLSSRTSWQAFKS